MKFKIDELDVYFPFPYVYKEQYEYMTELKHTLDNHGHTILEMPTGTGKTVSLLSLIISYQAANPNNFKKLIYCTRTVPEMEKTLKELRFVMESRKKEILDNKPILAVGLSARKNLCIHPKVIEYTSVREKTDAECRKRTAPWVRAKYKGQPDGDDFLCTFYEGFESEQEKLKLDSGVYTLQDLKVIGEKNGFCPYFFARKVISDANVVVYNYAYLLDPNISAMITKDMQGDCVVVFDEAHNIDDIAIEVYSIKINRSVLESANRNVDLLRTKVESVKDVDKKRLEQEYHKLIEGMTQKGIITPEMKIQESAGTIIEEMAKEAIPGSIRQADQFLNYLKKFISFIRGFISIKEVKILGPTSFLEEVSNTLRVEAGTLKFFSERLQILLNSLEMANTDEILSLSTIAQFGTYAATYSKGFSLIIEPFQEQSHEYFDPMLTFACLDSSIAMKNVFEKFQSVILTSGTMSPLEMYPKILDFKPYAMKSIDITLRNCINPLMVSRGIDQTDLSTQFSSRQDDNVVKNYGDMLIEIASTSPDGIVCFFPSYRYMEETVMKWNDLGVLDQLLKYKLLFIESKDVQETSLSLASFRKACENGRGAIFLSVARGKIAEGIDFDEHYGRCVIMFGVPFQYTKSRILLARLDYLRDNFGIKESDFLIFDAMRQCAQCVGRVIRKKNDYGIMIFADKRYSHIDKREKLPKWIRKYIDNSNININIDQAIYKARQFFKEMGQDYKIDASNYYTEADLTKDTNIKDAS